MNIIDRVVSYLSPVSGVKRAHARKLLRSYSGAESSRLTAHSKPKNQSADQELSGPFGADAMRAWARQMVRDNCYAASAVDAIVSNVVGSGITLQSILETKEGDDVEDVNDVRDRAFSDWCEAADINGQMTFCEMQVLAWREIVEAGEVLIRKIRTKGKEYKGISRPVPFALELIEADRLSRDHDTYKSSLKGEGNQIVRGVELDPTGKPVAYWIYKQHPNSPYAMFDREAERVLASDIIHLFRRDRVGQTRGISWFAPVMSTMRDLGVYIENELQSSAIASCFGVVIKGGQGGSLHSPDGEQIDKNGNYLEHVEPGIVARIGADEDISVINPARPNSAAEPWIKLMLRGISAGTGTSYEAVSKDFSGTSYSSSRTSKLEDRPKWKRYQQYTVSHFCLPVWDEFCNAAALAELDSFPNETELLEDRRGVAPIECQLPELEWVDPTSEQNAAEAAVKSNFSTVQSITGGLGRNWRSVYYQRAKEERLRRKLNLLSPEELQAEALAKQAGVGGIVDEQNAEQAIAEVGGEFMGMARRDWLNIRKAVRDVQRDFIAGTSTETFARTELAMLGVPDEFIEKLIEDAKDGMIDSLESDEVATDVE